MDFGKSNKDNGFGQIHNNSGKNIKEAKGANVKKDLSSVNFSKNKSVSQHNVRTDDDVIDVLASLKAALKLHTRSDAIRVLIKYGLQSALAKNTGAKKVFNAYLTAKRLTNK